MTTPIRQIPDFTRKKVAKPRIDFPIRVPSIYGTPAVGNLLTCTPQNQSVYQWQRADDIAGTNLTDIGGATGTSYVVQAADAGKFIRVGVVFA